MQIPFPSVVLVYMGITLWFSWVCSGKTDLSDGTQTAPVDSGTTDNIQRPEDMDLANTKKKPTPKKFIK